jgi:hypothetical protein
MRDDDGYIFLGIDRGRFGVNQQIGLAVSDGAEVLHRTGLEVGQRDQVQLFERIGNAEVIVVIMQQPTWPRRAKKASAQPCPA